MSYCGAGSEDYAYLVHLDGQDARVTDHVLLQSCLGSTSIVSDEPGDPLQALGPLDDRGAVRFLRISASDTSPVLMDLRVAGQKLELVEATPLPTK